MNCGVPQAHESLSSDSFAASQRSFFGLRHNAFRLGMISLGFLTVTPGIAAAQSTSARSCNRSAAFTGRVGPARPALCQTRGRGTVGPRGRAGDGGPRGFSGLPGVAGPAGLQGLLGPAGLTGANGLTGLTGGPGAEGPKGSTGLTGLTGGPGAEGPK